MVDIAHSPVERPAIKPSITIVMPCLNEEANLEAAANATLAALDRYGIDGELIVVNDGSTDRTRTVVEELCKRDGRICIVNHDHPHGIGASFLHGVREAKKSFVTMFPGDNENDPDDALTYFYMANDVDIIVPFIHNVEIRSPWRRFISSTYRFIINLSFGMNLNYTNGTVIYNTAVLRDFEIVSTGFFYQAEILIKLIRAGYLYAETPHFLTERRSGKTKALTLKSLREVIITYGRLIWDVHIVRRSGTTDVTLNSASATYRRIRLLNNSMPN